MNEIDTIALGHEVNPRIGSVASAHEFMDDSFGEFSDNQSTVGKAKTKEFLKMLDETNLPYIQQHDGPYRANYRLSKNYPEEPDTINVSRGNIDDALAELAHAYQYALPWVTEDTRDSLRASNSFQKSLYGDNDRYGVTDFMQDYKHDHEKTGDIDYYYPLPYQEYSQGWDGSEKMTSLSSKTEFQDYANHPGSKDALDAIDIEEALIMLKESSWRKSGDPLTVEFEAHSILEPWLYERFYGEEGRLGGQENPGKIRQKSEYLDSMVR